MIIFKNIVNVVADDPKIENPLNLPSRCKTKAISESHLDDSIYKYIEKELSQMKKSDKPKVCTKLFPPHNSGSFISALSNEDTLVKTPETMQGSTPEVSLLKNFTPLKEQSCNAIGTPPSLPIVKKENLVNKTIKFTKPTQAIKINVPLGLKIATVANQHTNVTLTSSDSKKFFLVPIKNSVNKQTVCVMKEPGKDIAEGDLFQAVKVDNSLQLVQVSPKDIACELLKNK